MRKNMHWLYFATEVSAEEQKAALKIAKAARVGKKQAKELKRILESGDKKGLAEFLAWLLASNGILLERNNVSFD